MSNNKPYQELTEEMGGELAQTIKALLGKKFWCNNSKCNCEMSLHSFHGYPHDGGLADQDGKKWWLFFTCNCGYKWSWSKLENLVRKFEKGIRG